MNDDRDHDFEVLSGPTKKYYYICTLVVMKHTFGFRVNMKCTFDFRDENNCVQTSRHGTL